MKRIGIVLAIIAGLFALAHLVPTHPVHAQEESNNLYLYIHTATTTAVRDGSGFLDAVNVNGGAGGIVSLYDIAASGCSGTPASGKLAAIASTTIPVTLFYNLRIQNGLCVVTAAATDMTVTYN